MGDPTYLERFMSWLAFRIARLLPWAVVEACFWEAASVGHNPEAMLGDVTVTQIMNRW